MLFLLMVTLSTALSAQQSEGGVFAPFVSRLRLAINDPQVRITWDPAPGVVSSYLVYRSQEEITTETLDQAELIGQVSAETGSYLDIPLERGSYHYAVLVEAADGRPIRFVIPGRNASIRPVEVAELASELERSAVIRAIEATVADARTVELTISADRGGRTLALYRSTTPILSINDLRTATLFREVASELRSAEDFPVPGVQYYYAAVDTARILAEEVELEAGRNTTAAPVLLPLTVAAADDASTAAPARTENTQPGESPAFEPISTAVRALPLPFLQLQTRLSTDEQLRNPRFFLGDRVRVGRETEGAIRTLLDLSTAQSAVPTGPRLLEIDTIENPSGANYTLQTILQGPFARMAWEEALIQLNNFLSLPLTEELRARAHYYRAQLYYQLHDSRQALLEFLLARDRYYPESEAWIGHILGRR
jgi:hypothetical protein